MRRAAPASQWQPRILEEVGSCPEYFSYGAPPLESEVAVFPRGYSRDGGVWGSCQKRKQGPFLPWGRGREGGDGLISICCNFLTKRTLVSPGKKGSKEKPRALGY